MYKGRVNIGLLGLGTIGGGVYELIESASGSRKNDIELNIAKALVRGPKEGRPILPDNVLTYNPDDILQNPEIDLIVELMGGTDPAEMHILTALKNGKPVVSANKAVLGASPRVFSAALAHKMNVGFEASVCGEIPIIDYASHHHNRDKIVCVEGIINGTTNYILTRMYEGLEFQAALGEAQSMGFAERDPSFDIEGWDAAQKLSIIATLVYGHRVDVSQVSRQSIDGITPQDIKYAEEFGYRIKPMAVARKHEGGVLELRVGPALVRNNDKVAHTDYQENALTLHREDGGISLGFSGAGAGKIPTARAVIDDIIKVVKTPFESRAGIYRLFTNPEKDFSGAAGSFESAHYLRLIVDNTPGVLAAVSNVLANHHINIEDVSQKGKEKDDGLIPMVMLSSPIKEEKIQKALADIRGFDFVKEVLAIRRKE